MSRTSLITPLCLLCLLIAVGPVLADPSFSVTSYTNGTSDGWVYFSGAGDVGYYALRNTKNGAYMHTQNTGTKQFGSEVTGGSGASTYSIFGRGEYLFPTYKVLLPDCVVNNSVAGCNIVSAELDLYYYANATGLGKTTYDITGVNPIVPGVVSAGDYPNFTNVLYSDIELTPPASAGVVAFPFNIAGLKNISATGNTSIMLRMNNDTYNNTLGWSNGAQTYIDIWNAEQGTIYIPSLKITYTSPVPISGNTANISYGFSPLTVQFTDTSSGTSSYLWDFGDGSTSTDQNPVHTFTTPYIYNVSQKCTNGYGSTFYNDTRIGVINKNGWRDDYSTNTVANYASQTGSFIFDTSNKILNDTTTSTGDAGQMYLNTTPGFGGIYHFDITPKAFDNIDGSFYTEYLFGAQKQSSYQYFSDSVPKYAVYMKQTAPGSLPNYYTALVLSIIWPNGTHLQLNNSYINLSNSYWPYTIDHKYNITTVWNPYVSQHRIKVYMDDTLMIDSSDNEVNTTGWFGVSEHAGRNTTTWYDNLSFIPDGNLPIVSFTNPVLTSLDGPTTFYLNNAGLDNGTSCDWSATNMTPGNETAISIASGNCSSQYVNLEAGKWKVDLSITNVTTVNTTSHIVNVSYPYTKRKDTTGIQFWPSDFIYNWPITDMPIHANSSNFLTTNPGTLIGYQGVPYDIVDDSIVGSGVTWAIPIQGFAAFNITIPYPAPHVEGVQYPELCTPSLSNDCHAVIFNKDRNIDYEFYRFNGTSNLSGIYTATRNNINWSANTGGIWNVSNYSLSTGGSSTASGLPELAGLLRYDEVSNGTVLHALNVALPYTRYCGWANYTWPSRTGVSIFTTNTSTNYPGMGTRFRLNSTYDISGYSATNQIILNGLKTYGMIVTDNSGDGQWVLLIGRDSRWNTIDLSALSGVPISAFEAVDESSLRLNRDSGQVQTTPPTYIPVASFTKSRIITIIPQSVTVTDTSTNTPTSWNWQWGDGTVNGTSAVMDHTYTSPGTYSINLEACNAAGCGQTSQTIQVVYPPSGGANSSKYNSWQPLRNDPLSVFLNVWSIITGIVAIVALGLALYFLKWMQDPNAVKGAGVGMTLLKSMVEGVIILAIFFMVIMYIGGTMSGL